MKASSTCTSGASAAASLRRRRSSSSPGSAIASSTCVGKYGRSPRWRPPRTIARLTQARPPSTLTARMSTSLSRRRCCRRPPAGAARATARRAGCGSPPPARTRSASACAIICACSVVHQLVLVAEQEALGVLDVARVVVGRDQAHARPRAALDLVQQARPRAVVEDGVLAGAQAEHLLDQLDRLLDRPGARERAEVAVLAVDRAAVVGDARERPRRRAAAGFGAAGDLQVRVALVVAEQDVEARHQAS